MFEFVNNCFFHRRAFGGLLAEGTRACRWQMVMAPSFMPRPLQALGSATQRVPTRRIGQFATENWSTTAHQMGRGPSRSGTWCAEIGFCYAEIFWAEGILRVSPEPKPGRASDGSRGNN